MRLIRFGVVGVINTLIDFGILNLLMFSFGAAAGFHLVLCNAVSFMAASLNSYFLNKRWTFGEKDAVSSRQYLLFLVLALGGLSVNSLVVYFMTTTMVIPSWLPPVLWANVAKICATGASMMCNYLTCHNIVFKKKPLPQNLWIEGGKN